MKIIFLFILTVFSTETFAYLCPLDPKLSKEEQEEVCRKGAESYARSLERMQIYDWPENPASPAQIRELIALGRSVAGTDKIPHRVNEICKGHVQCKGIFLWERNNRGEAVNPLVKVETDMRVQQKCNCENGQTFKPCAYYKQYLDDVIPHSRIAICAAIGCEKHYQSEKTKRENYLNRRIIPGLFTLARNFPKAFIDPIVASDEHRAYFTVIADAPELEPLAREEFKERLCRKDKQDEIGSDLAQCLSFVDQFIKLPTRIRPGGEPYSRVSHVSQDQ